VIEARQSRVESLLGRLVPWLTCLAAAILSLLWLPVPGYAAISPAFALIAIYCWSVWRPELLPYVAVFAIGVIEDLIRGAPLGGGPLTLLIAAAFVRSQHRLIHGKSFETFWAAFGMTALLVALATWAAQSFAHQRLLAPGPAALQFLFTVALFPVAAWLLSRAQRSMARLG
jgi:rod shape-determining protein MreD